MASKTVKEAQKSAFWGGMIYVPVSLIFVFIGTALFSFYHSGAASLPADLLGKADRIFPYFMVTIYSLLGGFEAVVWTDAIQGIVLIGGALATIIYILFAMPRGPGQLFTVAANNNKFGLGSLVLFFLNQLFG